MTLRSIPRLVSTDGGLRHTFCAGSEPRATPEMSTYDASTHENSRIATETLAFASSTIVVSTTAAGRFAEIDHDTRGTEFAGPLTDATIAALREVADE